MYGKDNELFVVIIMQINAQSSTGSLQPTPSQIISPFWQLCHLRNFLYFTSYNFLFCKLCLIKLIKIYQKKICILHIKKFKLNNMDNSFHQQHYRCRHLSTSTTLPPFLHHLQSPPPLATMINNLSITFNGYDHPTSSPIRLCHHSSYVGVSYQSRDKISGIATNQ